MSTAENPDGSVSMDTEVGPQGPTNEDHNYDFDSVSKGLDGEYDSNIEIIGDIHDTDIQSYRKAMESKYDKGELDGIGVVGDVTSVPGKDGVQNIEDYIELYENNLSELESLAESLDTEVYVVDGNNDPAEGALPGDQLIEPANEYAAENKEGFTEDDDYKEFAFDQLDRVQNISYDSVEIGDVTLVGGTHHTQPEIMEEYRGEVDLEDFDYDLDEIASELEDRHEPDYGFWGKIPVLGGVVQTLGTFLGYGDIEVDPEDVDLEELQELPDDLLEELGDKENLDQYLMERDKAREECEEKKQKLEDLLDDAGENVIVLDHGMPYGEGEDFELDYMGEDRGHQGSLAWGDLLEEYEVDTFFGGHFHGKGGMEGEIYGTDVHNVAKGQYMELGIKDGSMDEGYFYDQREWGGAKTQSDNGENLMNYIREEGGPESFFENLDDRFNDEELKESLRENKEQIEAAWERRENEGSQQERLRIPSDKMDEAEEIQQKARSGEISRQEAYEKLQELTVSPQGGAQPAQAGA